MMGKYWDQTTATACVHEHMGIRDFVICFHLLQITDLKSLIKTTSVACELRSEPDNAGLFLPSVSL